MAGEIILYEIKYYTGCKCSDRHEKVWQPFQISCVILLLVEKVSFVGKCVVKVWVSIFNNIN